MILTQQVKIILPSDIKIGETQKVLDQLGLKRRDVKLQTEGYRLWLEFETTLEVEV